MCSELDYDLPPSSSPSTRSSVGDEARLLVCDRVTGDVRHRSVADLPDEAGGHLVVVNDTRVVPARLASGARPAARWRCCSSNASPTTPGEALARPSRRLRVGETPAGDGGVRRAARALGGGRWRIRPGRAARRAALPPYIHERLDDPERYQTVYAAETGSAAAPTAGLHFTPELLARVAHERITLHVGLDTFRPVTAETLEAHELHGERLPRRGRRLQRIEAAEQVLAVGTTTTRVLETVARGGPLAGRSGPLHHAGFRFRRVDALLTNFHLPRTTLLALVMAFAGVERTRELYALAIRERYRFYSFGDAMLILGRGELLHARGDRRQAPRRRHPDGARRDPDARVHAGPPRER